MPNMQARCLALLVAVIPLAAAQPTSGQAYPAKPVRLVVPYAPGAGADLHARALAQKMTETLGQTVIVENRSGANGTLAMEFVAKSVPDGYTLTYALPAQYSVNPAVYPKLVYDPIRDFEPVTLVVRAPLVLFTHPSIPATSVAELIKLAKAKPGSLVLASAGAGSAGHLCLELFKTQSGVQVLHVLSAPDLRAAFEKEAIEIIGSTPEAFGEYLKSELVKWGRLVKSSGLKVD